MIARWGYEYGRSDQMQILSYSMFMNDNSLFGKDFYVQGIQEKVPNERYVFAKIMSWFGDKMEVASLVLHAIFTLFLLYLLFRIGKEFIRTDYLVWLALLVLFIFLYGFNLGGNELYYNTFFVSTPAKVIGLFGVWRFLKDKYLSAFILFGIAAILQAVVGLQLFATCAAILVLGKLLNRYNYTWLEIGKWSLGFLLTGGLWILFMKFFFEEASTQQIDFFTIFFEFRAPHHYVPDAFSKKSFLLLIPMTLIGFGYFVFHNFKLASFFLISFLGMAVYTLAFYGLRDVNLATLQWFKTTIWLKAFSVLALFAMLESLVDWLDDQRLRRLAFPVLGAVGAGLLGVLLFSRSLLFWNVPFDFGNQYTDDPRVDICLQAKAKTPKDALFAYPIDFTELKVYGERSGYADYKALSHRKVEMQGWYDRTKALYGVSRETQLAGKEVFAEAHANFRALDAGDLRTLKERRGITHLLTWREHVVDLEVVAGNLEFVVYLID